MFVTSMNRYPLACSALFAFAPSAAQADSSQSIMDKPHPVFGVPMGVVLLVFVAIAALKRK
jgi:hypothetical protein